MICKELLTMDIIKDGLQLCSGEQGLEHTIRWLYFTDCLECLDGQGNLLEWIHGGELIVVTNKTFAKHKEKLLELMRLGKEKDVAGFIINIGQTPQEAIQYSNEEGIPIFEIGYNLKMVDLSQIICLKLAEEVQYDTEMNQLLSSIIYPRGLSARDIEYRAEQYGISLSGMHYVMAFDVDHLTRLFSKRKITGDERQKILSSLLSYIRRDFCMAGMKKVPYLMRGDAILLLVCEEQFPRKEMTASIRRIQSDFYASQKRTVSVGIGGTYAHIDEFSNSMTEALQTVEVIHLYNEENGIRYFEDIGLYYVISRIDDKKMLEEYADKLLGPLIEADKYSDGNLYETLETYFYHDCNANATAEFLYIHRNTMRYRLNKIEKLLNRDLSNLENHTELNLAFHIKRFMKN